MLDISVLHKQNFVRVTKEGARRFNIELYPLRPPKELVRQVRRAYIAPLQIVKSVGSLFSEIA